MTWEVATFIQFVSLVAWVPGWRSRLGRRRANVRGCDERIVDIVLQVREARDDGCWLYVLLVVRVIRKSTLSKRTHLDGRFIPSRIFPPDLFAIAVSHITTATLTFVTSGILASAVRCHSAARDIQSLPFSMAATHEFVVTRVKNNDGLPKPSWIDINIILMDIVSGHILG